MLQFDRNKAAAVARETQNAFISFDAAYLSALQLATSVLEAKHGSNLPERDGQRLMQTVHDSAGNLLAGRAGMVAATAILQRVQSRSNQAETDFGCPGAGPWRLMGQGCDHEPTKLSIAS
jgi:hypothetical protein